MQDSSQEKTSPSEQLSRRDFLKDIAATSVLASGAGAIVENLALAGFFGEGHPLQRTAVLQKILFENELQPLNAELHQTALAWLKFNIAEAVGRKRELNLASDMIQHFLYGHGDVDITQKYIDSVRKHYHKPDLENASPDKILASHFVNSFSESQFELVNLSPDEFKNAAGKPDIPITIKSRMFPITEDIRLSLNRYVDTITGLANISLSEEDNSYRVQYGNTKHSISDRYQWDVGRMEINSQEMNVSHLLAAVGIYEPAIEKVLGQQTTQKLFKDTTVGIGAKDAILLEKYKMANSFNEVAHFELNEPITITIPQMFLHPS